MNSHITSFIDDSSSGQWNHIANIDCDYIHIIDNVKHIIAANYRY